MPGQQTPQDLAALAKKLGGTATAAPAGGATSAPAPAQPDLAKLAADLGGTATPATPAGASPAPAPAAPPPTLSGPLGDAMNAGGRAHAAATGAVADVARGLDPRTPGGRQNLAGAVGGAAAAYMTGGASLAGGTITATAAPWIARLLGSSVGAGLGGVAAETGEQMAGTKPPSTAAKAVAGLTQGAYELGGKLLLWPLRAAGTRFVAARRVATQAREAVESGVRTARTAANEAVDLARERGQQFMAGELRGVQSATRAAKQAAALDVDAAAMRGQREIADAQRLYDELLADPPSVLDAGQKVRAVVNPRDTGALPKGPAQRALDAVGARVSAAAETGPGIAIRPIQQALDQMANQARPAAVFNAGGPPADAAQIGFLQTIKQKLASRNPAAAGIQPGQPGHVLHADLDAINKEIAKQMGVAENHPLPGLLGKIATMPDGTVLAFRDAHQLKKLLDESVNWDRTASKHVEQITKGLRQTLREAMEVHEPYNRATRAFAEVVPLYRKSAGKQLIKAALDDPDKVVRVLSAKDPARAQQVKDLLVGQSAAGGDPALGQEAWQAIQSAWVYNHVIRGGPKDLSKRLATVLTENPEFSRIVLGDPTAQRVLSNIDAIGQAYTLAELRAGEQMLAAKTAGSASVQGARDAGARRLQQGRHASADATRVAGRSGREGVADAVATRQAFRASSVAPFGQPLATEHTAADVVRAGVLGPGTFTGALSLIRLLNGPKRNELIQWAALSDRNTQRLVQGLQSNLPATAVADLMRELSGAVGPGPGGREERTRADSSDQSGARRGRSATVPGAGGAGGAPQRDAPRR